MRYNIIWGSAQFPMVSEDLDTRAAQELIDDLDARGLTYTVTEAAHAHA